MEGNYKRITIRGRLKFRNTKDLKLNWYDNTEKIITTDDFQFVLNDYDFFEKYKQIQDLNDLEFLKITKIEEIKPEGNYEELW